MGEGINIKGTILVELFDARGCLKDSRKVENIVTNAGRQAIIDRLQGSTPAAAAFIAIGTGATAAATTDTTLGTEVARSSSAAPLTQPDAHTDRCIETFAAGIGTGSITEAGRLTANSGGVLMGRQVFTAVVKTSTDSLQITYDFTYIAA
jgi:hypothetical protein